MHTMGTFQLGQRHELPPLRLIQELESLHKGRIQSKSGFLGKFAKHSDRQLVIYGCLRVCPQNPQSDRLLMWSFRQQNNAN